MDIVQLKKSKVKSLSGMAGSNEVYKLNIEKHGTWIYKPKSGEIYLRESIRKGTYYKREVAAYIVSSALDFNIVSISDNSVSELSLSKGNLFFSLTILNQPS